MPTGPAYRIETDRCVVRCFELADARALHDVLAADAGHLARWLAWARDEPQPLHVHLQLVRAFRRRFDGDEDYAYGVFDAGDGVLLGSVSLHPVPGEPGAWSLGYWIAREHGGRGLATEAAGALVRCAFEVERAARVEIHCDASNARSRALAARLGFRLDAELRERGHAPGEARAVHSLLASEHPASLAARIGLAAQDALGEVLVERAPARRSALR